MPKGLTISAQNGGLLRNRCGSTLPSTSSPLRSKLSANEGSTVRWSQHRYNPTANMDKGLGPPPPPAKHRTNIRFIVNASSYLLTLLVEHSPTPSHSSSSSSPDPQHFQNQTRNGSMEGQSYLLVASERTPPPPPLNARGVPIRSRNGATSRKGFVGNGQATTVSKKISAPPFARGWSPLLFGVYIQPGRPFSTVDRRFSARRS